MKTLTACWLDYRDKMYPDGIHANQNRETHQAFFAGAAIALELCAQAAEMPDDIGPARIQAIGLEAITTLEANLKPAKPS